MQFWIDTVAQWEKDTGKSVIVGLSATKDVQDAILADPVRSKVVDVIDIRYWWYESNGGAYAPAGGLNLAPRQLEHVFPHQNSSFAQVYRAVREYRQKYPDKAIMYSADGQTPFGWAALMGGGSLADIRSPIDPALLQVIPSMHPINAPNGELALGDDNQNYVIYAGRGTIKFDLSSSQHSYNLHWINPRSGEHVNSPGSVDSKTAEFRSPGNGMTVLWLSHQ